MDYIKSNDIKVFPAAGRSADYPTGYLLTEDNLNSTMRSLYPRDFVIEYENSSSKKILRFVIHGYYFEINNFEDLGDSLTNLWATIYLKQSLENTQHTRLVSKDNDSYLDESVADGKFKGVYFSTTNNATDITGLDKFSLQILSNGQISEKSKLRFKTSEILNNDTSDLINSKFTTGSLNTTNIQNTNNISTNSLTSSSITTSTISASSITTSSITTSTININTSANIETLTVSNNINGSSLSISNSINANNLTISNNISSNTISNSHGITTGTLSVATSGTISSLTVTNDATISTLESTSYELEHGKIGDMTLSGSITGGKLVNTDISGSYTLSGTINSSDAIFSGGNINSANLSNNTISGGTLSGSITATNLTLSGGTLSRSTLSNPILKGDLDCTTSGAKIKTSSIDSMTPSNILTNVTISTTASNRVLIIDLLYTRGKD